MRQEFLDFLKKGHFRIPVCVSCDRKAWPPAPFCPRCLSNTTFREIDATGILVEFSYSHMKAKEGMFGVVDLDGVRLVGSFETHPMRKGMKVRMKSCGVDAEGGPFYVFAPVETPA